MTADLVTELRDFARAYPVDVFGPVTEAELHEHANLITRNSAAMGRHFGPWFARAADEIERLRTAIDQVHNARLTWAMVCPCRCKPCDEFYEFVRDTLPDCSDDVSPPQESR